MVSPALVATTSGAATSPVGTVDASLLTVRLNGAPVADVAANLPLTQDIDFGTTYSVCCTDGVATSKIFSAGWSLASLITAAGAAPNTVESVTIERAGAAAGITLLPPDFDAATPGGLDYPMSACAPATPPAGSEWSCPAFIYATGSGTNQSLNFFRPERTSPPADQNVADWIQSAVGSGLTVDIVGPHIAVSASSDRRKVRVGEHVHFAATATSPITGDQLVFTWSLSDGTTLDGARVTHVFARPGAYQAVATVSGSSGSGGTSAPITIAVGKAPGAPGPGGATSTSGPPTKGADHGGTAGSTAEPGPQPTTVTVPIPGPLPVPVPGSIKPAGKVKGAGSRVAARPAVGARPTAAVETAGARGHALVRGDLLVDSASRSGAVGVASPGVKRATGPGGTHVSAPSRRWWAAMLGIGVVIALYGFGAASERPGARRRRRHVRGARVLGEPA